MGVPIGLEANPIIITPDQLFQPDHGQPRITAPHRTDPPRLEVDGRSAKVVFPGGLSLEDFLRQAPAERTKSFFDGLYNGQEFPQGKVILPFSQLPEGPQRLEFYEAREIGTEPGEETQGPSMFYVSGHAYEKTKPVEPDLQTIEEGIRVDGLEPVAHILYITEPVIGDDGQIMTNEDGTEKRRVIDSVIFFVQTTPADADSPLPEFPDKEDPPPPPLLLPPNGGGSGANSSAFIAVDRANRPDREKSIAFGDLPSPDRTRSGRAI